MNAALVLGLSIHGLAVCRSLGNRGVPTFALSAEKHPANTTRYATVIVEPDVNSPNIVELLCRLGPSLSENGKVVLFPTNDTMVREIAKRWGLLDKWFLISWSETIERILELQRKDRLPRLAKSAQVLHPITVELTEVSDIRRVGPEIGFPCIVKPALPLSSFKVCKIESAAELSEKFAGWLDDLPLVAQELIPGIDTDLFFYAGFWKSGNELAGLSGRKVHSIPAAMGQGTILESVLNVSVLEIGRKFSRHVEIDGPIAVEFKRQNDGKYVMIEPNVGRTEYCVDLLVQSGFDIPYLDYLTTTNSSTVLNIDQNSYRPCTWYDTERDPFGYIRDCLDSKSLCPRGTRPIFPYMGHRDLRPVVSNFRLRVARPVIGALRRFRNVFRTRNA